MTDSDKLDKLITDVAEIKGSIRTLSVMHNATEKQVSKMEGRIWGLMVGVLAAFGSSLLAMFMSKVTNSPHVAEAARAVFAALTQ